MFAPCGTSTQKCVHERTRVVHAQHALKSLETPSCAEVLSATRLSGVQFEQGLPPAPPVPFPEEGAEPSPAGEPCRRGGGLGETDCVALGAY